MLANVGLRDPFYATINSKSFEEGFNIYNAAYRPNTNSAINAGQNLSYLPTLEIYNPELMKMTQPLGSYISPVLSEFEISGSNDKNGGGIADEMVTMLLIDMQEELNLFYPESLNDARVADFSKKMNITWNNLVNQRYPYAMSQAFDRYVYGLEGKYDPKDLNQMFHDFQINNSENIILNLRRQFENLAIRITDTEIVSSLNIKIMNLSELVLSDRMLVFNGIDAVFTSMMFIATNNFMKFLNEALDMKDLFEND